MRTRSKVLICAGLFAAGLGATLVVPVARAVVANPESRTVTSSIRAFEVKQAGGGIAGRFEITNPSSAAIALDGVSSGTGHALLAWNLGLGRGAVIITSNSSNTLPTLDVSSQSKGPAARVASNNASGVDPAVKIQSAGPIVDVLVDHGNAAGDLAVFNVQGNQKIRFTHGGRALFGGGVRPLGTEVTVTFPGTSDVTAAPVGTVVAISPNVDGKVRLTGGAYSRRVAGVLASTPGIVLTDRGVTESVDGLALVAVGGVARVRVKASNGPIARGDLLVASATPGVAMRGTDRSKMLGAVIGKALAPFKGPGGGRIPALVTLD